MDRKEEFREAVKDTSKHLLSHHRPDRYYRCYSLSFFDRDLHLCARCTGIYPGIIAGLISISLFETSLPPLWIAISVIPTFIEKYLTGIRGHRGLNSVRTLTGFLLGLGYINGLITILRNPFQPYLIGIGILYIVLAGILILKQRS